MRGSWATRTKYERMSRENETLGETAYLPRANQIDIGLTTVYATMQPGGPAGSPSASMGVDWMGSDSEVLEATVKRVAKESIVVSGVEVRMRV